MKIYHATLFAAALSVAACDFPVRIERPEQTDGGFRETIGDVDDEYVRVGFSLCMDNGGQTKSAWSYGSAIENALSGDQVIIYSVDRGALEGVYSLDEDVKVRRGGTYRFCVIRNYWLIHKTSGAKATVAQLGDLGAIAGQPNAGNKFKFDGSSANADYRYESYADIATYGLPAAGVSRDYAISASTTIPVTLHRLVARYLFKFNQSALNDGGHYVITGVKFCNMVSAINPLWTGPETLGTMTANQEVGMMNVSAACSGDVNYINTNGSAYLYCLSNMMGDIAGITTQSQRIPDNMGDKAQLCTYLEVSTLYTNGNYFLSNVPITFRAYLGRVSNFDVVGNYTTDIYFSVRNTSAFLDAGWRIDSPIVGMNPDPDDGGGSGDIIIEF